MVGVDPVEGEQFLHRDPDRRPAAPDPDDHLLVIDDVFDSGRSIEAFLLELAQRCRANMPRTVAIATVYYKPARNRTALKPDFYVHECDDWLVFPHELCGLSEAEIRAHKPQAAIVLDTE